MKTYATNCHVCSCPLQWPAGTGTYAGLEKHFVIVHPALTLRLAEYRFEPRP